MGVGVGMGRHVGVGEWMVCRLVMTCLWLTNISSTEACHRGPLVLVGEGHGRRPVVITEPPIRHLPARGAPPGPQGTPQAPFGPLVARTPARH